MGRIIRQNEVSADNRGVDSDKKTDVSQEMTKACEESQAFVLARATGIEPATTGSTVRYSNQLSYAPNCSMNRQLYLLVIGQQVGTFAKFSQPNTSASISHKIRHYRDNLNNPQLRTARTTPPLTAASSDRLGKLPPRSVLDLDFYRVRYSRSELRKGFHGAIFP